MHGCSTGELLASAAFMRDANKWSQCIKLLCCPLKVNTRLFNPVTVASISNPGPAEAVPGRCAQVVRLPAGEHADARLGGVQGDDYCTGVGQR